MRHLINTKAGDLSAGVGMIGDLVACVVGHKDVRRGNTRVDTTVWSGEFGFALDGGWPSVWDSVRYQGRGQNAMAGEASMGRGPDKANGP